MHLELTRHALALQADGSSSALAPRDAALLAWLALEGPTPRTHLAELLWPESGLTAARNTLRQRLFRLRKHCGELVEGGEILRLAAAVRHDLVDDSDGVLGGLQFPDAPGARRLAARPARATHRRRPPWRSSARLGRSRTRASSPPRCRSPRRCSASMS